MPCYSPLRAYRSQGGKIVFNRSDGWTDRPVDLACGQCVGCRIERSRQWAVRCVHESQLHDRNSFVTLTYNQENLPVDGGLHMDHWQKFAKRLRKKIGSFRFFMCGEYGDENKRPHYHALFFGIDFSGDRSLWKRDRGNNLYKSPLLEKTWGKGYCSVGDLTYQSAAYVSRYILKKINGAQAEQHYQRVDTDTGEVHQVRPEFVSMSRKPGIASKWFDKYQSDVYPHDEIILEGSRFRPPRYYDQKLQLEKLEEITARRKTKFEGRLHESTPDRLRQREALQKRKIETLKRTM